MFKGGYLGRILRIDLTTEFSSTEKIRPPELRSFLGGRGLAAKYYHDELSADIDPLDEANKLIFMTGPLTGMALPSTTKFQLSTKSPETGHYLCSNCGGEFGPQLKKSGFDGLIVEGRARDWTALIIKDGEVRFLDARPIVGCTTAESLSWLKHENGDSKASALAIGPAGEGLVHLSYINVDSRAFGRGGAGAVMGSKRLKGITVSGSGDVSSGSPQEVEAIRKAATKELHTTRANHTKFGTAQYIEVINELGCMPTRNFQTAHFSAGEMIDAQAMKASYFDRNYACYRCPVACGKVCTVKEGPFAGAKARTEYETIGLLGPNCGVSDFATIVAANQLCDEIGIDTISCGNAVGLTMELYERGLIDSRDTAGIEARFGSGQAMLELIRLIGERRAVGELLAQGMKAVKKQKPEWAPYILEVKGMPFAAYDPRGFFGNGLTYGTSNRGACHNVGGWTIRAELQSGKYDRFGLEGKGALVKSIQDNRAYVDSLGICTVVRGAMGFSDQPEGTVLEAVTGYAFTPHLMEIGERIYNLERLILVREGVRRRDDQLPYRITNEPIPSGPTEGRILTEEMYNRMLDEYYAERGWDSDGIPAESTLERLELNKELLQENGKNK